MRSLGLTQTPFESRQSDMQFFYRVVGVGVTTGKVLLSSAHEDLQLAG